MAKRKDAPEPEAYEFDDMPKRFKRMVAPHPVRREKPAVQPVMQKKGKVADETDVRPGESFKQYNTRLGLVPGSKKSSDVGSGKSFKQKISESFAEARGMRTKRKEHLKLRDTKKKRPQNEDDDTMDGLVRMESIRFGETAMAPPQISSKPKTSKVTLGFKRK